MTHSVIVWRAIRWHTYLNNGLGYTNSWQLCLCPHSCLAEFYKAVPKHLKQQVSYFTDNVLVFSHLRLTTMQCKVEANKLVDTWNMIKLLKGLWHCVVSSRDHYCQHCPTLVADDITSKSQAWDSALLASFKLLAKTRKTTLSLRALQINVWPSSHVKQAWILQQHVQEVRPW